MTKSEFVDKVAATSGLSKKDADNAVNAVISTIETSLQRGEDVNVHRASASSTSPSAAPARVATRARARR